MKLTLCDFRFPAIVPSLSDPGKFHLIFLVQFSGPIVQFVSPTLEASRTEPEFVEHIARTMKIDDNAEWIFVVDNRNTHQSANLVEGGARKCVWGDAPGKKVAGILKSPASRREFLSQSCHRIRFTESFGLALDGQKCLEPPTPCKCGGEGEAKWIALRLGQPPVGYGHGTLPLLADEMVALEVVESIRHETVRKTLKKTV